jgi:hypothetical protein
LPNKRILGPFLAAVLLAAIAVAVGMSHSHKNAQGGSILSSSALTEVKGMIGSEKESFFSDGEVVRLFADKGFRVRTEKVGSRQIISRDLQAYDFAFPAGVPAAQALQRKAGAGRVYAAFFTPMAIGSWKRIVPILESRNVVGKSGNFHIIDMARLLQLIDQGVRWNELKGNADYVTGKSILINSTDVRTSNSAAMYLALASYVANGNNVIDSAEQARAVLPKVMPLFLRQGFQESSSAGPFEDYTTMGMGKAPLVMIYESQFLEHQFKRAQPNPEMVLLYPRPTLYSKHVFVPFSENGERLGQLLASDPELQKMAVRHGYRTAHAQYFTDFLKEKNLEAPETLIDVIDPPSYEILERMIQAIESSPQ